MKMSVSVKPTTRSAIVVPIVSCRSGSVRQTCATPFVTSSRKWCSPHSGFVSRTRIRDMRKAEPAKVAESRTATTPPPKAA